MKDERLRESGATDPSWSALERLCQSQPPTAPDLAMQARVLARLERPRRQALRLRPAFVALCVLLFAGAASALWGAARRWLAPAPPAATAPASLPVRPRPVPATSSPPTTSAPADSAPAALAVRAVAPPSHVQRRKQVVAAERVADSVETKPIETSPPPPSKSAPLLDPQESVLVHAAVRALRVDGRTSRARALLSEYLSRFPHGALAEDAVALQIEAAVAERDSIAARRWATRYVGDFPSGRFRAAADSVLHDDSSKESSGSRP
ncbi:MAG TPA: hypothetical protein VGL86_07550 [Polyangia bacterium]|jgi:hypothetical protein